MDVSVVSKKIELNIKGCARCGGDHFGILVARFELETQGARYDRGFYYWVLCPSNGEPVVVETAVTVKL